MGPTLYRRRFRAAEWLILGLLLPLAPARAAGVGDPRGNTIEALALLQALLRQEAASPPGSGIGAARVLAVFFSDKGIGCDLIEPEPGRGSLLCTVKRGGSGGGSGRPILLVAQLGAAASQGAGSDAEGEPAEPIPGGAQPAVPPRVGAQGGLQEGLRDGRICGRGLLAGKGMAAVTAEAMAVLAHQAPLTRDILFVAAADGTTTGEFGLKWLLEHRPELVQAEVALGGGGGLIETGGKVAAAAVQADGPIEEAFLPQALRRALEGLAPGARLEAATGPAPLELGLLRGRGVQAYGFMPFPLSAAPAGNGDGAAEGGGTGAEECLSVEDLEFGVRLMIALVRQLTAA